jgi:hypothetical protein
VLEVAEIQFRFNVLPFNVLTPVSVAAVSDRRLAWTFRRSESAATEAQAACLPAF